MNKQIIILAVLLMLISGCSIGNYKINIEKINDKEKVKSNISEVSILDLNLHPEQYDGKQVKITGIVARSWLQSPNVVLRDKDGFEVGVEDLVERGFDEGETYTAIGIFHNEKGAYSPIYIEATEPVRK